MIFIGPPGRIRPYTARQQKVGNPYDFGALRHDHSVAHFLNMIPGDIFLFHPYMYILVLIYIFEKENKNFFKFCQT